MTGMACSVCTNPNVRAINEALVAGERVASVARRFRLSDDSVRRHFDRKHWPRPTGAAAETIKAEAEAQGNALYAMAHRLRDKTIALALAAEDRGDLRTAIAGMTSATRTLSLMGELRGDIDRSSTTVNVSVTNNVQIVQTAVLSALAPYPEARLAVAQALEAIEHDGG